TG
ncbi:hypothetical protein AB1N83_009690, partial [Pleurotus pulmonarius]